MAGTENAVIEFGPSKFDSEVTGLNVLRVHVRALSDVEAVRQLVLGKKCDLLFAITHDFGLLGDLCSAGWVGTVDVRYDFEKKDTGKGSEIMFPGVRVTDPEAIRPLAEAAFGGGGFFSDRRLQPFEAKWYGTWAENAVKDGRCVRAILTEGKVSAFLIGRLEPEHQVGRVELIAVDPVQRSNGLGEALMKQFALSLPVGWACRVKTAVDRVRTMQFYQRVGYKPLAAEAMVSLWVKEARND